MGQGTGADKWGAQGWGGIVIRDQRPRLAEAEALQVGVWGDWRRGPQGWPSCSVM